MAGKKDKKPGKKRICTCGCDKFVTAQTERNHLKGRTTPLVKVHNAARRLSVLGLSPDRVQHRISHSVVLSPRRSKLHRLGRAKVTGSVNGEAMDVDSDAEDGPDEDILPQFGGEGTAVHAPSPDADAGPDMDVDNDVPIPVNNAGAAPELFDPLAVVDLQNATARVREGVWSNGHIVTMEDVEEDADAAMYMDANLASEAEHAGPEGEDDFWADKDQDYDEYESLYGLPAEDLIGEDMERELAEFGQFI